MEGGWPVLDRRSVADEIILATNGLAVVGQLAWRVAVGGRRTVLQFVGDLPQCEVSCWPVRRSDEGGHGDPCRNVAGGDTEIGRHP